MSVSSKGLYPLFAELLPMVRGSGAYFLAALLAFGVRGDFKRLEGGVFGGLVALVLELLNFLGVSWRRSSAPSICGSFVEGIEPDCGSGWLWVSLSSSSSTSSRAVEKSCRVLSSPSSSESQFSSARAASGVSSTMNKIDYKV